MKRASLLASTLLVQLAVSVLGLTCPETPTYNTTLNPICGASDLYVKLPYYENPDWYYECMGTANPVLSKCPVDTIFNYVKQKCTTCAEYVPAPPCENLKTQDENNCYPIGSSTPTPATTEPPTTPSTPATVTDPTTKRTTTPSTPAPVTDPTTKRTTAGPADTSSPSSVTTAGLPTPYYPNTTYPQPGSDSTPGTGTTSGGGIGTKTTPAPDDSSTPSGGINTRSTPSSAATTPSSGTTFAIPTAPVEGGTTLVPMPPTPPPTPPVFVAPTQTNIKSM